MFNSNKNKRQNNQGYNRNGNRGGYRGQYRSNHDRNDDYYFNSAIQKNNNQNNYNNSEKNYYNSNKNTINYDNSQQNQRNKHRGGYKENRKKYNENDYFEEAINNKNLNSDINNKINSNFNYNEKKDKEKDIHFSIPQLRDVQNVEDNQLVQFFSKFKDLSSVFNNTRWHSNNSDLVYLMTHLLARISEINSGPASLILNQIIENTSFIENTIKQNLSSMNFDEQRYLKFLLDTAILSSKLLDKFSETNKRIKANDLLEYSELLQEIVTKNENSSNNIDMNLSLQVIDKINEFKEKEKRKKLEQYNNKIHQKEVKEMKEQENNTLKSDEIPIDYKGREIEISYKDFSTNEKKLISKHIIKGSYTSYSRYLNTMFYLEYEDCYSSLRNTIYNLQLNGTSINDMKPKNIKLIEHEYKDIYFYINGEIIYIEIGKDGVIITIDFCAPINKKIKFTKRMITGSLIVITNNKFDSYLLTTVFYNPYVDKKINNSKNKNPKVKIPKQPYYRVQLSVVNLSPESFMFLVNNRKKLQLFESKAYFESYIHIMKRLQTMQVEDLPFKNELVDCNFQKC